MIHRPKNEEPDLRPIALHHRVTKLEAHAAAMIAWRASIDASTEVQKEMVIVGQDIVSALRLLGWIGKAAKWLASVALATYVIMNALKWGSRIWP